MTIDTLEYTKKLEAAGVDRKVAEAHAEALKAAVETSLVTKDYLDKRLLQHTIAVVAAFSAIAGRFKLFS
jgi:hypothetical protein